MRIYVAGPMTGYPEFNYPAFEEAAARLRAAGYDVVSPHEINSAGDLDHSWDWFMRRDIADLVTCDAVATLAGWATSRGAQLEVSIAKGLGMPFDFVDYWLAQAGIG